jgi:cyclophilin family peptidyl-prolyl cis-trans isomerase/protein-disulfide isomerase
MSKLSPLLFIAFLLTACGSQLPTTNPTPTIEGIVTGASLPAASCTAVNSADRENYLSTSPYPQPETTDWQRGPESAQVTLIEYSDFQCPFCAELSAVLHELQVRYPADLRIIYRHFPLIGTPEQPLHDKAALALQAAEAAGRQDHFWEMHDLLFAEQANWTTMTLEDFEDWLVEATATLELDVAQFTADLHDPELEQLAQDKWADGQELQIGGTPFVLINGIPYSGPLDVFSLDAILQLEMLRSRQFEVCPTMALEPGASYTATLHTEKGDIVVELFPEVAPIAVNSFVFLAENDWFDNVSFHRVLPGFVAQAGDPTGSGYGGPGYSFAIEPDPDLVFDRPGLLAMANSGPTSNGSQFFITFGPAEHLNGQFTIFGEVIQGMDVAESLTPRDPSQAADLPQGDLILDVTIEVH